MNAVTDTITAIATPPGRGGIAVVRISGPGVPDIARALLGRLPAPRRATYAAFHSRDDVPIDQGICLYFPQPKSFTGEHVLELQGHGGSVVQDMLLARVLELGARMARPGEFSERAFLNGKMDLAQAEAVADLIDSGSQAAARSAVRSLQGAFSRRIHDLVEAIVELRMYVEAAIDFPEEEIDFLADHQVGDTLDRLLVNTDKLLASARQGRLLRDGMRIALVGPPNAGKSSLLNALAETERAIVSDTPGTTRDIVDQHIQIDGLPLHLLDTAGLRDAVDAVEHEGVSRAKAAMREADRVLVVIDDAVPADIDKLFSHLPDQTAATLVRNKVDMSGRAPGLEQDNSLPQVAISAKTGAGLDVLRAHLKHCMGFEPVGEGTFIARRRHLEALQRARERMRAGQQHLVGQRAGELLAEELRLAQQALSEITGAFTSDDLLGRIFSSFCIGK